MARRTAALLLAALALLPGGAVRAARGDDPPPAGGGGEKETPEQEKKRRELELQKARDALPDTARPALALLDEFRDRDFRVWSTLRDRIVACGRDGTPALRVYLREPDWEVRAFAASCLAVLRDPSTAVDLSDAYSSEKYAEARRQYVVALAAIAASSSAKTFRTAAAEDDPGVRLAAVRGMGNLKDPALVPDLKGFVQDKELDIRYEARGALAALGDKPTLDELVKEAGDLVEDRVARRKNSEPKEDNESRYSQYLLGAALARAKDKAVDRVLLDAVQAEKPWDNKDFFRMGAAEGLGVRAGLGEEPNPVLLAGTGHRDDRVRLACTYAAGFARSASFLPRLKAALQDPQLDVRHNAVVALGRMGTPEAAKALRSALFDRAGEVRIGAVRALTDVAGAESTEGLVMALRDSKYMIRAQAARALSHRIAEAGVVEGLVRAAKDGDFGVRAQALASLAHAADAKAVVDTLAGALGDADFGVRTAACLALATLPDRDAVGAREDAMRKVVVLYLSPDVDRVTRAARECLDAVRSPAVVPPLLDALTVDNEETRRRADIALRQVSETTRNFDPANPVEGARRWREWWAGQGGKLKPRGHRRIAVTGDFLEAARDLKWKGLDISLLFDSTASMNALISAAKERIDEIIRELGMLLPSLRVSVYTYRDETDDYLFYGTPLTYDSWKLTGFLQTAVSAQGRDIPEAIYPAVKNAAENLRWRPGAHKVIVFAGDAPYHPDVEGAFLKFIAKFFTKENQAVLHGLFTDTNRRSLDIKARTERTDMSKFHSAFFEKFRLVSEAGRGRAVLLDDESALIKEMLVLTFGEAWRTDIENVLDFEM
jgi:HEAT repeat protein